jgi:hypothetical protein
VPWCICFLLICEISLVVLQIHVDYTILIFQPLVRTLDLLTGHAWSIIERLMSLSKVPGSVTLRLADDLPCVWDPSPKNQLLPSNHKANCKSASLCSFSHCGVRNALLGCGTEILFVTVMGVVLTLTDFHLRAVETRLEENQQHFRQT